MSKFTRYFWSAFFVAEFAVAAGCSRENVNQSIAVTVVDESRTIDPFGAAKSSRHAAAGIQVYLAPASAPYSTLKKRSTSWKKLTTDKYGQVHFTDVEGLFHILVDVNDDGTMDDRELKVPSGSSTTIIVRSLGEQSGDDWLKVKLDFKTYVYGDKPKFILQGYVTQKQKIELQAWQKDDDTGKSALVETVLSTVLAGKVAEEGTFTIAPEWPMTPSYTLDDYLVVPMAGDRAFTGALFSVRKQSKSNLITGMSVQINNGDLQTISRNAILTLAASNAVAMAFSEDPLELSAPGVTKFAYSTSFGFQLSAGDGVKTVYAMYFDARGNVAGPVRDTILLDSTPTIPITGKSIVIAGGAAETQSANVTIALTATNAYYMAFSENLANFPDSVTKYAYSNNFGTQLSAGEGLKILWVGFYDMYGNYSAAISDTIVLNNEPPVMPDSNLFVVLSLPPGSHDFLTGLAGSVEPNSLVEVYADTALAVVTASGFSNDDGSFGPLDIGDNVVTKPQDYVWIVATDSFNRSSGATPAYNDSTPPDMRYIDMAGAWTVDSMGAQIGNPGDVYTVTYTVPDAFAYAPASDAVRGIVDFSKFGGPGTVPTSPYGPPNFSASYTLPADLVMSSTVVNYRMRIYDDAGNVSPWVTSPGFVTIDTIPPLTPFIYKHGGGNREMGAAWTTSDPSASMYSVEITSTFGYSSVITMNYFSYLATIYFANQNSDLPSGVYPFQGLDNCKYYYLKVRALDDAGNSSGYSNMVSDRVILKPPRFEAWAGLSAATSGSLAFSMVKVTNSTAAWLYFDTDAGVPYTYSGTTATSPTLKNTPAEGIVYLFYLKDLPLRTTFYLASRAVDDVDSTCLSDYSSEMSGTTDLRLLATSDGVARSTVGGALALVRDYAGAATVPDILVGAPFPQNVVAINGFDGVSFGSFGKYFTPDSYDIPGSPLAAADIDGDGLDDYIVGSPLQDNGAALLAGEFNVYGHVPGAPLDTVSGTVRGLQFGFTIANLGHIEDDLVPGAFNADAFAVGGFGCEHQTCGGTPASTAPTEGPGAVVVFQWNATLSKAVPLYLLPGHVKGDYFGISIAGGQDLSGDGVNDFVVGAPGNSYYQPAIAAYVYSGATGQEIGQISNEGSQISNRAGAALALLPDIDGDGLGEVVIGAPGYGEFAGFVSARSSNGWQEMWRHSGALLVTGSGFGSVVVTGGDINGDGTPDIVVGSPNSLQSLFYGSGEAFVLDGKTGRTLYEMRGSGNDGSVGYSALILGDVNGLSRDEWAVGAPGSAYGGYQSGRVYILTTDP